MPDNDLNEDWFCALGQETISEAKPSSLALASPNVDAFMRETGAIGFEPVSRMADAKPSTPISDAEHAENVAHFMRECGM